MADIPEPISDNDKLLHNIIDGTPDITDMIPTSREEEYLKYIALNGAGGGFSTEVLNWDPILLGGVGSDPEYTIIDSIAKYVLLGDLIYITCDFTVKIINLNNSYLNVGGLPYKGKNRSGFQILSVPFVAGLKYTFNSKDYYPDICMVAPNSTTIQFQMRSQDGMYEPYPNHINDEYYDNNVDIKFSGMYIHE